MATGQVFFSSSRTRAQEFLKNKALAPVTEPPPRSSPPWSMPMLRVVMWTVRSWGACFGFALGWSTLIRAFSRKVEQLEILEVWYGFPTIADVMWFQNLQIGSRGATKEQFRKAKELGPQVVHLSKRSWVVLQMFRELQYLVCLYVALCLRLQKLLCARFTKFPICSTNYSPFSFSTLSTAHLSQGSPIFGSTSGATMLASELVTNNGLSD